jgi:hypothetical protein
MEEDAGKSVHEEGFIGPHGESSSGIDLNRAGTPLLEIVTEPVMRSAAEAVAYAKALHTLVVWLGVCDGNMQEGSFRCDANVSVRPMGQTEFGTRCEIKNLNSFRFLEEAIQYEVRRQIELIEDGGTVIQETRLYDPDRGETRSMRSKEDANDYRYFPDPDLLPVVIDARSTVSIFALCAVLNAAHELPGDTPTPLSLVALSSSYAIELDEYPASATARPCRPGDLPPGIAMVGLSTTAHTAQTLPWRRPPTLRDSEAPHAGLYAGLIVGAASERIELVAPI